ncbi:MAG: GNAT family N-acetyltransferase [Caldilineaceae bacterium]|nr:GNAT family N-acetyltransferase [Caldilineaceae bacterium]
MSLSIRHAQPEDVPQLVALINSFAERNLMLPRTDAAVMQALPDWLVAEDEVDGQRRVVGCGALAALTAEMAEVRSLAVDPSQHGKGVGSVIVENLVALARAREFRSVCALTLRERFFVRLGFEIVDRWSVSPKLWQECIYCPKFHRCDEVAVLKSLVTQPVDEDEGNQPVAWNPLMKHASWRQPLRLAYNRRPIRLNDE